MDHPATGKPSQSSNTLHPQAGDWVRVRTADQITGTLDMQGMTGGMPFMPEMLPFCGRVFRIAKVADNVCVNNNVRSLGKSIVLQTARRCDGSAHGGCQFGCHFFWRPEWLQAANQSDVGKVLQQNGIDATELVQLTQAVTTQSKNGEVLFVCQATSLNQSSEHISVKQLDQYSKAVRNNRTSIFRVLSFFWYLIRKKATGMSDSIAGPCQGRTPVESLQLQLGDSVRVKSIEEIRDTLDKNGCNRGLWFDREEMQKYCGQTMQVSRRIERIIDEQSGKLLELKVPSVVLEETACSGFYRRFCARGMLFMWRECWLERV